jgi:hypothetical protein
MYNYAAATKDYRRLRKETLINTYSLSLLTLYLLKGLFHDLTQPPIFSRIIIIRLRWSWNIVWKLRIDAVRTDRAKGDLLAILFFSIVITAAARGAGVAAAYGLVVINMGETIGADSSERWGCHCGCQVEIL